MKTNKFKLDIVNKNKEFNLRIKVDNIDFLSEIDVDNVLFFEELIKSSESSGKYLLFTCSCGVADCSGWDYIKIMHNSENIIWDFEHENLFHFEFNKEEYNSEINRIKKELKAKKIILEPTFVTYPE